MARRLGLGAVVIALAVPASAGAAAGDLDQSFGQGGVAKLPNGASYSAQGAPLLQAGGRIVVGGLLRSTADRGFLGALTEAGATDTGFGSGGEVHTKLGPPSHRVATALLPGGAIAVVRGSKTSGTIRIERFTANGVRDSTFGSGGELVHNLGGQAVNPTAVVPAPGGGLLVGAAWRTRGVTEFTVLKFRTAQINGTFGTSGRTRISFGSQPSFPFDLAVDSAGRIVVVGAYGNPGEAGSDTAIARLTPGGALDSSFSGDAKLIDNVGGGSEGDHASGVAIEEGDGFIVAGPSRGVGMVARYTPAGARNPAFGTGGVVPGDFARIPPAAKAFAPTDVAIDSSGRIVIAGPATFASAPTTRWEAARLNPEGPPLDESFGYRGHAVLTRCANDSGFGPSGLATGISDRITIQGSCDDDGRLSVVRLQGGGAAPTNASLDASPGVLPAGHERIVLGNLDPGAVGGAGAASLQAAPLRRTELVQSPLRRTAIGSTPLRRTSLGTAAMGATLLSSIPLRRTSWEALLGVDAPLQTLTLADAFAINPGAVGALTLDDLDPNAIPLRRTSLASLVLGMRPLSALPDPDGGWCAFLAPQPYDCSNGVNPASTPLFDLEIAGDDLSAYLSEPLSLRDTDLGSGSTAAPVSSYLLRDMDLGIRPYRSVRAEEVSSILSCGGSCQGTLADQSDADLGNATIGQLVALLPVPSLADLTVGEALAGLLPAADIPYESTPFAALLDEAEFRSAELHAYRATFVVACSQTRGLLAIPQLPDDARLVPGSATVSVNGGQRHPVPDAEREDRADGAFAYDLSGLCSGRGGAFVDLRFDVEPGSELGPVETAIVIRNRIGETSADDITAVDDSHDPGDGFEQALPLTEDVIRTGHIASSADVDTFTFEGVPGTTTITLSHLPADYDLAVYGPGQGPEATPLRRTSLGATPLRRTAVPDASLEPTDPTVIEPDLVQDIPLRRTPLRRTSINRGTEDEAASITVRPEEAGEQFTVQVIGYNGASDPRAYVLRRIDRPGGGPLPCPSRSLDSSFPASFPSTVPADTQALYLVAPQRLAAREGNAATQSLMTTLGQLAQETGGVIVPVGDDPQVNTDPAFAAWDAQPCSPERANEVVTAVNGVVDHVRQLGNGLPELRSIVLVGPDDVLPQGRVPDRTAIANESEYADDAAIGGNDNAASGSLRRSYLLSDDPYGDFDPGLNYYVPDVALGRLIESAAQIEAQVDHFLTTDGVLDPQRAFVTGYDFLSDGAEREREALEVLTPGATSSRIDETWTASDALGGINAPGAAWLAPNAHFDHFRAMPAAAFNGTDPNLFSASQASPPAGSFAFTVGCHGGLNLAVAPSGGGADPALGDWAERMASQQTVYTANTGFGYGDSEGVAYSEQLMADYADLLAGREVTAGQALMFAKQENAAELAVADDYWMKASMEATYYGLPMLRIGDDGGVGAAAPPPPEGDGGGGVPQPIDRSSDPLSVDLRDDFRRVNTDRGTYWRISGEEPLVVQRRPIVPKTTVDVTSDAGEAHSFLVESYTTVDVAGLNPVLGRPTVDLSENEPEPTADDPFFPANLSTIEREATPEGERERLTLMAGSFRGNIQRFVPSVGGRVLRSNSADFEPPVIRRVDASVIGSSFSIRVETDGDEPLGGNVLYLTDEDAAGTGDHAWRRADLSVTGANLLGTGGVLPSGTRIQEAIVQVYDVDHDLALSDRKVLNFTFRPPPPPGPGDPRVVLNPPTPASGYHTSSPLISLNPGEHDDATFFRSVDGGPYQPYTGPFRIAAPIEGEHLVSFVGSDGSTAAERFAVDTQGPTVIAEPDRTANEHGWFNAPVTVTFRCADAVSGVASCPAPVTLGQEGRNRSATGTATDRAGNSGSGGITGINIDRTNPKVAITTSSGSILIGGSGRLRGTASDALSGVRTVVVTWTNTVSGQTVKTNADSLTCDVSGQCQWTAPPPPTGVWSATARSIDYADNASADSASTLITVR